MGDVLYTRIRGRERDSAEAMLAYSLSWYVLPNGPKEWINPYVVLLAIRQAKGEKLALAPIFLGSLLFCLDECVQNLLNSVGRYTVVSYADIAFLQLFLWGRFENLGPQPAQFEAVNIVTVEDENGIVKSVPDKPIRWELKDGPTWNNRKVKSLWSNIDSKKYFSFHPYTFTPRGIAEVKLYAALGSDIVEISSKEVSI